MGSPENIIGNSGLSEMNFEMLKKLPVPVYACDTEGTIRFFNSAASRLWGREPVLNQDKWCGSLKIYDADGAALEQEESTIAITIKGGKPVTGREIIIEKPDGERRSVLTFPTPVFDAEDNISGAISILIDITDRKKPEDPAVSGDIFYRQLVQGLPAAAYMCDMEGKILLYNQSAVELWGREPSGADLWCGSYKAYSNGLQLLVTPIENAIKTGRFGTRDELMLERPDHTYRHVIPNVQPVYDEQGELVAVINMILDITQQRDMELALRESERKYRELADSLEQQVQERTLSLIRKNEELRRSEERYSRMVEEVQDYAILMLDKDGIVSNWNAGAEKIKGYKEADIIGRHFHLFYLPEDRAKGLPDKLLTEAREKGKAIHEGWRMRKDGTTFWGSVVITALHDKQNQVIGFSKVTRDLTERKVAEDTLRQYSLNLESKNKELEQFAYIASHDLQEPLRKIQTFSNMLLERPEDAETTHRYLQKVSNSAKRMTSLIRDVLNYSRFTQMDREPEPIHLETILQNIICDFELLIDEKGARIHISELPVLLGIPIQIHQLFTNLISNSLKFNDKNPELTVSSRILSRKETSEISGLDPEKTYAEILCSDNGIGFEPRYADQIFRLFNRLNDRQKYEGTGLGLALCKRIVESHHGYISAESELGKGAIFRVYLPVAD